jgi:hypothetical protein
MRKVCVMISAALLLGVFTTPLPAQGEPDIDPLARHMLQAMSRTLTEAREVSFKVRATIDIVDDTGLMVQSGETAHVALRHPDRLMVRTNSSRGRRGFTYDGETATIYHIDYESYSSAEVPASIDGALDQLEREYGFILPVADFVSSDPYESLMSGVTEGIYLGLTELDGISCHHLVFREADVDWQIWIEDTAWHLPRKFIVTFKEMEGWPQYTVYFADWNRRAALPDAIFRFDPPEIARKIRFRTLDGE